MKTRCSSTSIPTVIESAATAVRADIGIPTKKTSIQGETESKRKSKRTEMIHRGVLSRSCKNCDLACPCCDMPYLVRILPRLAGWLAGRGKAWHGMAW